MSLVASRSAMPRKAPATITNPITTEVAWITWRRSGHCTRCSSRQLPCRKCTSRVKMPGLWAGACAPVVATAPAPSASAPSRRDRRPARLGLVDLVLELLEPLLVQRLRILGVVERRLGVGQLRVGVGEVRPAQCQLRLSQVDIRRRVANRRGDVVLEPGGSLSRAAACRRSSGAAALTLLRAFTVASHDQLRSAQRVSR